MTPSKTNLSSLRNLGKITTELLQTVGIETMEDLQAFGAVEAYKLLKAAYPHRVSLNALWGIEGALVNIDWREIPQGRKSELLQELENA